jgi:hypothetical protein
MFLEINENNEDIAKLATKAIDDREFLSEILHGLKSKNETIRYNCYKCLMVISKTQGEVLYPLWEYFVELLCSDNSYYKMSAVHIITGLTRIDTEDKFAKIFEKYYSLLDDKSMIVAVYVARNSAQIIKAKPGLENKITGILLNIDKTRHPATRKELIKAGAIEAFMGYFPDAGNKSGILDFVMKQQSSKSPKTRKTARAFLKKWGQLST